MTLPCSREAAVGLIGVGADDRAHGGGRTEVLYPQEEVLCGRPTAFPQEASALGWNPSPLWPTPSMSYHSFHT